MNNSRLTIYFNPNADYGVGLKFHYIKNTTFAIVFTWQVYANAATELMEYLNEYHSDKMTATISNNLVTIIAVDPEATFSRGLPLYPVNQGALVFQYYNVTPPPPPPPLTSDRYLINNEIWINLSSTTNVDYFKISAKNLTTQRTSGSLLIRPDVTNNAMVNLSAVAKTLMEYPDNNSDNTTPNQLINTAAKIEISIYTRPINGEEKLQLTMVKTFIRGGNRTNDINQTLPAGAILRPTDKLPVWDGFPTAEYYLNENNEVIKRLINEVSPGDIDYRRTRGCNELYFEFLNQDGGYSNWLFDSHNETESNTAIGSFIRNNKVDDLGSDSASKLQVYGKIPAEYIDLINDLIVSSEIYVYLNNERVRITSKNNNISKDNFKRSYAVTLNFGFEYRFNPSPKWSN